MDNPKGKVGIPSFWEGFGEGNPQGNQWWWFLSKQEGIPGTGNSFPNGNLRKVPVALIGFPFSTNSFPGTLLVWDQPVEISRPLGGGWTGSQRAKKGPFVGLNGKILFPRGGSLLWGKNGFFGTFGGWVGVPGPFKFSGRNKGPLGKTFFGVGLGGGGIISPKGLILNFWDLGPEIQLFFQETLFL